MQKQESTNADGSGDGPVRTERRDLIFRVFVSSTFEDMKPERNALQKVVFPQLREYCRQRNARFQAVDLRWGVSEESSFDQQTMSICMRELERCQQISPRPNFVVLLGNRYGWVPLPASIQADEFDLLLGPISRVEADRIVLDEWYRLDENAEPGQYVLLPREGEFRNEDAWRAVEDQLRKILKAAAKEVFEENDLRLRKYFESATHQEINHGALHPDLETRKHVLACFRDIQGLPEDEQAKGFRDLIFYDHNHAVVDTDGEDRLGKLLEKLKSDDSPVVLPENRYEYAVKWGDPHLTWEPPRGVDDIERIQEEMPEKLQVLCEQVLSGLQRIIDDELRRFRALPVLDRERDSHKDFGLDRCRNFVGRGDVLDRIKSYLASDEQTPLVIHGPSGFGKTALMAEAWRTLIDPDQTVARFIGATPGSADLRSLLHSLCAQLGIESPPEEMNELVTAFRKRLSGGSDGGVQPAVLFLDALDQLNDTDSARMLSWLPRELAPGVKLVLSVLDDEGQRECFDAASRWSDAMLPLGPLSPAEGAEILKLWLTDAARKLQPAQRDDVLAKFTDDGGPLFLKLSFEQARRWRSWDPLPRADGLIGQTAAAHQVGRLSTLAGCGD
jgi:hypothetical protein